MGVPYQNLSPEEIDQKIAEETRLVATLESSYPKYYPKAGRYDPVNLPWERHCVKIRDSYWRRRNLQAVKDKDFSGDSTSVY